MKSKTSEVLLDYNFKPITYKQNFVGFKESDVVDGGIITVVELGRDGVVVKLADKMKVPDFLTKHYEMNLDRALTQRIQGEPLLSIKRA